MSDTNKESKYWIKPNIAVEHINSPGIVMVVDAIKKEKRLIDVQGKPTEKTFVLGVECHWTDKDLTIQNKVFHTYELRPHLRLDVLTDPQ